MREGIKMKTVLKKGGKALMIGSVIYAVDRYRYKKTIENFENKMELYAVYVELQKNYLEYLRQEQIAKELNITRLEKQMAEMETDDVDDVLRQEEINEIQKEMGFSSARDWAENVVGIKI